MGNQFFSPSSPSEEHQKSQIAVDDKKNPEAVIAGVLGVLRKEYVVIGTARVNVFRSWLLIGLVAGIAIGIIFVANRSGEVEPIAAESMRQSEEHGQQRFVPGELILKFRKGVSDKEKDEFITKKGFKIKDENKGMNVRLVLVPEGEEDSIKKALSQNPNIEYIEYNNTYNLLAAPNDYGYSFQWQYQRINLPGAWDFTTGNNSIIAVVDGGVYPHEDLIANLINGLDFVMDSYSGDGKGILNYYGATEHGTRVSAFAAETTNNVMNYAGVGWNSRIMPIRVCYVDGICDAWLTGNGIHWAAEYGASVINVSIGGTWINQYMKDAANFALSKGVVVVAGGGNTSSGCGPDEYKVDGTIIHVGATGDSYIWTGSCTGGHIDAVAPGMGVVGLWCEQNQNCTGTSFAAPIVSGVIALMRAANPSLTPYQLERILEATADDSGSLGYDTTYGWGRINAFKAVKQATEGPLPPVDTTPPGLSITYPTSGLDVGGMTRVNVMAADDVGVTRVELYVDGVFYSTLYTATTYSFLWDSIEYENGLHTVQAKAYDAAGNVGSSNSVSVSVKNILNDTNPPSVVITKPASGSTLSKTTTISVNASDDIGVQNVEIYFDSKLKSSCLYTESVPVTTTCEYRLNVSKISRGTHTIFASAYDAKGNMSTTSITVKK